MVTLVPKLLVLLVLLMLVLGLMLVGVVRATDTLGQPRLMMRRRTLRGGDARARGDGPHAGKRLEVMVVLHAAGSVAWLWLRRGSGHAFVRSNMLGSRGG